MTTLEALEGIGPDIEAQRDALTGLLGDAAELSRQAHSEGHSISEIARAAGVSRPTIYQWIKEQK